MEMASCSTLDTLNDLPEIILDNIFSRLSIRDAVRTSILSTSWRYKWVSTSHLNFTDGCIRISDGSLGHDKLVRIVNHVLLLHRGPILAFKISCSDLQSCSEIDSWILHLLPSPLTEFKLKISKSRHHNVLPCLFSFKKLIHLSLVGCIITLPVKFKGFDFLTNLNLQKVALTTATLKCLVSNCPQLEHLTLNDIDVPIHIEISNPKLKYLQISGKFNGIRLKDLRLLVYASIDATTAAYSDHRRTGNFSDILGSLLSIQILVLDGWFFQSLAAGYVARRPPRTYNHLKSLYFALNTEDMKEISVAICLLNSSPNLQELEIVFWHKREYAIVPVMDLREAKDQLECTFNKLRTVNMSKLFGVETELILIKFILANSPMLETMYITLGKRAIELVSLLKELLQFRRASPEAEIYIVSETYTENYRDGGQEYN